MKHVNRLAVGGFSLTLGWVIFVYVPHELVRAAAGAILLLGIAYLAGYWILRR